VALPQTPSEWLPILTKGLDDQQSRVALLKRYMDSDAPLPEMGPNLRAAWQRFQKESRTNWAQLIVGSVADRVVPLGIAIAGSSESDEAKLAQRIWRDNRMDLVVKQLVRDGVAYRDSYLCVWTGDDGQAIITSESAEFMYLEIDPVQPWKVRAAIKVWRDEVQGSDYAYVWVLGGRQKFSRPTTRMVGNSKRLHLKAVSGDWRVASEFEPISGDIPIYAYSNPIGWGEFELHLDLINRINRGILQRLVTTAMQAFRQRALKRKADGAYEDDGKDEEGNDQDWSKIFEPAPGALWDLPEGVELWESGVTDITPMLSAEKGDLRDLAAVTRTPLPMLVPDGANQSATGAAEMTSGLYFKARDCVQVVKIILAAALLKAMRAEGVEPSGTIEVLLESPERVTMTEKYAAAAQAKGAGESWKSIQRNILGRTPEQIQQDAQDRAEEQLAAAMLVGSGTQPGAA
jgi:hypothetical protein